MTTIEKDWAERVRAAAATKTPLCLRAGATQAFYGRAPAGEVFALRAHRGVAAHESTQLVVPVRGRTPPDSGMVARKLEDAALVVVASPDYLARRGTPHKTADLAAHECLQFVLPSSGQAVPWVLRDAAGRVQDERRIEVRGAAVRQGTARSVR